MRDTWAEKELGDLVEFHDSKRVPLSGRERAERQGPFPYYGASGIIDYIDDFIFDGRFLLVAEDGANLTTRRTPIAFFAEGRFWVNNHAHIIRGVKGVADDYFLKAWFDQADILGYITGAAQPKLSQSNLKKIRVSVPPISIQRRISSILSAYDDLIDNNTRRIAILEEMAQAIYREWFVHLRFPGHENVELVESELGSIPVGWDVGDLIDFVEVNPRTPVDRDTDKPYVPMASLSESSMSIGDTETRTGSSGSKFKNGDTLFARITPCLENGKTGYVRFLPSDDDVAIGSTEFVVLRSPILGGEYAYCLARSDALRSHAIKSMTGASGRQRVQMAALHGYRMLKPAAKALAAFKAKAAPMFDLVYKLSEQSRVVRQSRDLLLPKLISGEIDVSELDIDTGEMVA